MNIKLGGMLCALDRLDLPNGLRHQLGLAKPFGLGVMRVEIDHLSVMQPEARYNAFLETAPDLADAEAPAILADGLLEKTVAEFQKEFAKIWHAKSSVDSMWKSRASRN